MIIRDIISSPPGLVTTHCRAAGVVNAMHVSASYSTQRSKIKDNANAYSLILARISLSLNSWYSCLSALSRPTMFAERAKVIGTGDVGRRKGSGCE